MPKQTVAFYALNRGEVSRLALDRVDVDKLRLSAEQQINWLPYTMGPMTLRPGLGHQGSIKNDSPCKLIEFIYSSDDKALIELTDSLLRIWIDGAVVTRAANASSVPAFASWTTSPSPGATITTAGNLAISGVLYGNVSSAYGQMTIDAGDVGKEIALRIVISKGSLAFKIGTTIGGSEILATTNLDVGTHSIAFTPSGTTVYCQFDSSKYALRVVDSIQVEAAGELSLPTTWTETDLPYVRYDTSADVVFVACQGHPQKKIERRSATSWSIVDYIVLDGPFPSAPGNDAFQITASAYEGDVTLTANKAFFTQDHVGSLLRLFHNGQTRQVDLNKGDTWSRPIRVSGISANAGTMFTGSNDRVFAINLTGTWVGTVTVERTYDPDGLSNWVKYLTYTTNGLRGIDDGMNNVVAWYRVGFQAADYTSGTVSIGVTYNGGGGAGIARIRTVPNSTTANAEVLDYINSDGVHAGYFANHGPCSDYRLSEWSAAAKGYPSSVTLHEGRLWWSGANKIWGSVSDAYQSFDYEKTGDAAPISRSIGKGPVAHTNFLLSFSRLAMGTDSGIVTARSSSFDEPLTPTAFNLKYSTNQGAAPLRALQVDNHGVFVQRSNRRVYLLSFQAQTADFVPIDLTRLNLDIGIPGFVDLTVQRQPDTRLLFVRGDGKLAVLLFDEQDDVQAWWRIETDGVIENVAVLPGQLEDEVYVVVARTIGGVTKRFLEKFARLDECKGGATSKLADSHVVYSGAPTTVLAGLDHLEGKAVVVWGDGKEIGFDQNNPATVATYTVASGKIVLPTAVSNAVTGLPYTATFVSAKLAYAAAQGTAINQVKRVGHIGIVADTMHYQAIRYGHWHEDPAEMILRSLPPVERGKPTPVDTIWSSYDQQQFPFPGEWDTDARIMIQGQAPRPATICGFTLEMETSG